MLPRTPRELRSRTNFVMHLRLKKPLNQPPGLTPFSRGGALCALHLVPGFVVERGGCAQVVDDFDFLEGFFC